jgi:hypothetical protein
MLSRIVADQAGAATAAPRSRVYRWSSGRQPKTRPSAASLCYEGWSVRSPKFGAGNRHIASASASPIHKHSGSRIEDTQNHPASGWRPSTFDKPLRWRTATEIRARSWETSGEPPDYTTPWGLLKQPDKHQLARTGVAISSPAMLYLQRAGAVAALGTAHLAPERTAGEIPWTSPYISARMPRPAQRRWCRFKLECCFARL